MAEANFLRAVRKANGTGTWADSVLVPDCDGCCHGRRGDRSRGGHSRYRRGVMAVVMLVWSWWHGGD